MPLAWAVLICLFKIGRSVARNGSRVRYQLCTVYSSVERVSKTDPGISHVSDIEHLWKPFLFLLSQILECVDLSSFCIWWSSLCFFFFFCLVFLVFLFFFFFCFVFIRVFLASCDKSISRFNRSTTTRICNIRSAKSRYCAQIIVILSR